MGELSMNCKLADKAGVYVIRNTVNGHFYIGSTGNFRKRVNGHLCALRNDKHANRHLQKEFRVYGESAFVFSLEETCVASELEKAEQRWLDGVENRKSLYNIFPTAYSVRGENHPMFGHSHSAGAREKIKQARARQVVSHSPETRLKMGLKSKGRRMTPAAIAKMRISKLGSTPWNKGKTAKEDARLANEYRVVFSDSQLEYAISSYAEGVSINDLSRRLGVQWETVKRELVASGVRIRTIGEQKRLRDQVAAIPVPLSLFESLEAE